MLHMQPVKLIIYSVPINYILSFYHGDYYIYILENIKIK